MERLISFSQRLSKEAVGSDMQREAYGILVCNCEQNLQITPGMAFKRTRRDGDCAFYKLTGESLCSIGVVAVPRTLDVYCFFFFY